MKKRALCALVSLALCVTLAGQAAAAESSVSFVVNGITLAADVPNRVEARTTYVSYWPIVSALYPNATAEWVNGQAEVKADGLTLHIKPGAQYVEANGRYLYVPDGVKCEGYSIMVPIRTLCQALGAGVEWDGTQSTIQITSGSGPILSGEQAYQADVVYWLSRIIYAESGNQPLDGKIAVGNVVLNRVASPRFPNSVYEVIFQRNQFTPAANGSINRTPSAESVVAAKLCLDGANTAGSALYFVNPTVAPEAGPPGTAPMWRPSGPTLSTGKARQKAETIGLGFLLCKSTAKWPCIAIFACCHDMCIV